MQRTHGDAEILRAQDIIEAQIEEAPSVEEAARQVAMTRRNLVCRFKSATGNTPRAQAGWRSMDHEALGNPSGASP